jgi:translation initiation factor 3 subunit H
MQRSDSLKTAASVASFSAASALPPPTASAPAWAHVAEMSGEELPRQEVAREVHVDGLAALKIIRHCNESMPSMVAGSLLGLDVDGILEVTYAYPFPASKADPEARGDRDPSESTPKEELDGNEYQMEMMKMLRDVNVDNNCLGWYQSMFLGTMYTPEVVACQFSYQSAEDLSDNAILIMYDPIQSKKSSLVLKAFKLSDQYLEMRRNKVNSYIKPGDILVEIPLYIKSTGHMSGFLRCLHDSHREELNCTFEPLSLNASDSYTERHLELVGNLMDDFFDEQKKLYMYSKSVAKPRQEQIRWLYKRRDENVERVEDGKEELPLTLASPLPEGPPRLDHILIVGQLDTYCKQVNQHVDASLHKLYATLQIHNS